MVLHLARDCKFRRKNFRFYHCFGEEDGMKHLKRRLAIVLHVLMFMPFASVAVMFMHVCRCALYKRACTYVCVCVPRVWCFFPLGVARAAHPNQKSRWILYMMKLRLISMKGKIKTLLESVYGVHAFLGGINLESFWMRMCYKHVPFMCSLRLNQSVKRRIQQHAWRTKRAN